ncbi:SDR family oxidoreductase [Flexivirga caeni]|uniref:SDR family oxidoreductase n=1 Tax=Flexivirga caeni TaxID=2294115 RepID=UPI001315157E|nr:SDR family oxidoreductase [Flexivirga caeni]
MHQPARHHLCERTTQGASQLLAKAAAADFAPYGIRVNSVPGRVIDATEQNRDLMRTPESIAPFVEAIPLGWVGQAVEVARVVLFLSRDEASYVAGAEILVDGGYIAV